VPTRLSAQDYPGLVPGITRSTLWPIGAVLAGGEIFNTVPSATGNLVNFVDAFFTGFNCCSIPAIIRNA